MRRVYRDALISAGTLLLLIAILVSIDGRVRDQLVGLMGGSSGSSELADFLNNVVEIMLMTARDQTIAYAPLVVFAVASTILLLFMVRT